MSGGPLPCKGQSRKRTRGKVLVQDGKPAIVASSSGQSEAEDWIKDVIVPVIVERFLKTKQLSTKEKDE